MPPASSNCSCPCLASSSSVSRQSTEKPGAKIATIFVPSRASFIRVSSVAGSSHFARPNRDASRMRLSANRHQNGISTSGRHFRHVIDLMSYAILIYLRPTCLPPIFHPIQTNTTARYLPTCEAHRQSLCICCQMQQSRCLNLHVRHCPTVVMHCWKQFLRPLETSRSSAALQKK